jgi:hypothetical protein
LSAATYSPKDTASRAWERLKAYTNAFEKTKLEGKSLAEWMFCIQQYPRDPQDGYNFLYVEGDSALGGEKYISFEQTSVLTDVVAIEELEDITPEDLELLVQKGLENREWEREEESDIESNELIADDEEEEDLDEEEQQKEKLAADVAGKLVDDLEQIDIEPNEPVAGGTVDIPKFFLNYEVMF